MKLVKTLDRTQWKNFVELNPQGNIFHTPEMFEVFQQAEGHHPSLWAVVGKDDRILALLLPVRIYMNSRMLKMVSRDIVYGGVLYELSDQGREGLGFLLEAYRKESRGSNLFTELRHISETTAVQPVLQNNQFDYEDHLNYIINLDRTPEEILNTIGKRTRKHISRGIRSGKLTVEVVKEPEMVSVCYDLIKTTYQNSSVPIAHPSLFEAAFDLLSDKGMVQFLLAKVNHTPVAASVELIYKNVIYGWYSGMDRKFSSYTPNEMIMWQILSWGAEHGCRSYDFGGAGKPDEDYGVRTFKAKFGGDLVNYGRNKYIAFPVFYKVTEFGYRCLKRILFSKNPLGSAISNAVEEKN